VIVLISGRADHQLSLIVGLRRETNRKRKREGGKALQARELERAAAEIRLGAGLLLHGAVLTSEGLFWCGFRRKQEKTKVLYAKFCSFSWTLYFKSTSDTVRTGRL